MMNRMMKVILACSLMMSLAGCTQGNADVEEGTANNTVDEVKDDTSNNDVNEVGDTAEDTEEQITNYFYNENNYEPELYNVAVKPGLVYWEDGKLIAQCFVINGNAHEVYGIKVNKLQFANEDGAIASGSFGELNDLTVPANSYALWTFVFNENDVDLVDSDLSYLSCQYNVSYKP